MIHCAVSHSSEEKRFLGVTIPAGTNGPESLRIALDTLFNHPNVGPFICRQLIQRMVTSNPSPGYIERVANKFNDDGSGVRGNMKAVFTQILMDREARSPLSIGKPPPFWGKLREPVLRFVQLLRLLEAQPISQNTVWEIMPEIDQVTCSGQRSSPTTTVFNFSDSGYSPLGTAISANELIAPGFQSVDEFSITNLANCLAAFLQHGVREMKINLDHFARVADQPEELVRRVNLLLAHNSLSEATQVIMKGALAKLPAGAANSHLRARSALLMALAATDYLIERQEI